MIRKLPIVATEIQQGLTWATSRFLHFANEDPVRTCANFFDDLTFH
jgi:hypothetical protein